MCIHYLALSFSLLLFFIEYRLAAVWKGGRPLISKPCNLKLKTRCPYILLYKALLTKPLFRSPYAIRIHNQSVAIVWRPFTIQYNLSIHDSLSSCVQYLQSCPWSCPWTWSWWAGPRSPAWTPTRSDPTLPPSAQPHKTFISDVFIEWKHTVKK